MAEGLEASLPVRTPEKQQNVVTVHLVTGNHAISADQANIIRNKLDSGDLTIHTWEPNIVKQLKSSHPQPTVLSVDSLAPEHPGKQAERDYDAGQKRRVWELLPGRPADINSSRDVFLVAGDTVGESYREVLKPFYSKNASSPEAQKNALDVLMKNRPSIDSTSSMEMPDLFTYIPSAAAAMVALTAAVNLGEQQISKKHQEALTAKTYTRRSLLKLGVFSAGMLATGALLNRYGPSMSVPKSLDDSVLDTIIRIAKREKSDQSSIDGRTALLIEKGILGALYLDQAEVTVVAGSAHGHNKDNLLASPQARADAIVAYAKTLLKIVNEASDKAGFNTDTKLSARGILLDNLLYGQILRASDTGTNHATPGEVDQILDKSIHFQSDFMLGGSVVSDAVDNLRQGAPKVYGPFGMNINK